MGRALLVLSDRSTREKACKWIRDAPPNTRVTFQSSRRNLSQNAKLWASLTDISEQVEYHGMKLMASDWKLVLMQALNTEMRIVPSIDGKGFVNLGSSSSSLSKHEMSMLIELAICFGTERGVKFSDHKAEETNGQSG